MTVDKLFSKEKQVGKREKSGLALEKAKKAISEAKLKKRRKPLKLMSKKQAKELKTWAECKKERGELLIAKFGYMPCEYCEQPINKDNPILKYDPHHNDHDRRNNTLENCRILHRTCHGHVHDRNIKDVKSLL